MPAFRSPASFPRSLVLGALAAFLAVAFVACGRKDDPLPPHSLAPRPATDLKIAQRGDTLVLEFAYPPASVSGLALAGLEAVELWSTGETLAGTEGRPLPGPRELEALARKIVTIQGAELTSAVQGDRISLRLPVRALPASGARQIFVVRTIAKGGDSSAFSNAVAFAPGPSPPPPVEFGLAAEAEGIRLSWRQVEGAAGYHVYRRLSTERGVGAPLAFAGETETGYFDKSARLGERYVYTLCSVASREPLFESAPSIEREVDYQDRFGPPPPGRPVALAEQGEARLMWEASAGEDVAGYVIFRQDPGQGFRRVNLAPIAELEARDTGLVSGLTYRYRIAAIDRSGNLGEPTETFTATVR
jgi:hypothetical protein